jgi:putative spermidine/putrescine transport system permease protein
MKRSKFWPWVIFAIGAVYFLLPLLATFEFSLRIQRSGYSFLAYTNVFQSPAFQQTFAYSLIVGAAAIVVGLAIVVPAAYFVRLRAPQLRPIIEFVTLLPLIIPPIILVFGYIRLYNSSSILPLTNTDLGTNVLLTLAYVALALPYMYRAVDTGLRTIDVQTLTEAANILGANTPTILIKVIFPNILVAVLSGAFLTLAIVIGEFTIASLLNRPAFGVYMQNVGANRARGDLLHHHLGRHGHDPASRAFRAPHRRTDGLNHGRRIPPHRQSREGLRRQCRGQGRQPDL